jgi:hypothetical protein
MKRLLNELLSEHTGQPVDAIGKPLGGWGIIQSCHALFSFLSLCFSPSATPLSLPSLIHLLLLVEQITERDKFMSPQEAHDFGIIDHVLTHSPKQTTDSEASTNK